MATGFPLAGGHGALPPSNFALFAGATQSQITRFGEHADASELARPDANVQKVTFLGPDGVLALQPLASIPDLAQFITNNLLASVMTGNVFPIGPYGLYIHTHNGYAGITWAKGEFPVTALPVNPDEGSVPILTRSHSQHVTNMLPYAVQVRLSPQELEDAKNSNAGLYTVQLSVAKQIDASVKTTLCTIAMSALAEVPDSVRVASVAQQAPLCLWSPITFFHAKKRIHGCASRGDGGMATALGWVRQLREELFLPETNVMMLHATTAALLTMDNREMFLGGQEGLDRFKAGIPGLTSFRGHTIGVASTYRSADLAQGGNVLESVSRTGEFYIGHDPSIGEAPLIPGENWHGVSIYNEDMDGWHTVKPEDMAHHAIWWDDEGQPSEKLFAMADDYFKRGEYDENGHTPDPMIRWKCDSGYRERMEKQIQKTVADGPPRDVSPQKHARVIKTLVAAQAGLVQRIGNISMYHLPVSVVHAAAVWMKNKYEDSSGTDARYAPSTYEWDKIPAFQAPAASQQLFGASASASASTSASSSSGGAGGSSSSKSASSSAKGPKASGDLASKPGDALPLPTHDAHASVALGAVNFPEFNVKAAGYKALGNPDNDIWLHWEAFEAAGYGWPLFEYAFTWLLLPFDNRSAHLKLIREGFPYPLQFMLIRDDIRRLMASAIIYKQGCGATLVSHIQATNGMDVQLGISTIVYRWRAGTLIVDDKEIMILPHVSHISYSGGKGVSFAHPDEWLTANQSNERNPRRGDIYVVGQRIGSGRDMEYCSLFGEGKFDLNGYLLHAVDRRNSGHFEGWPLLFKTLQIHEAQEYRQTREQYMQQEAFNINLARGTVRDPSAKSGHTIWSSGTASFDGPAFIGQRDIHEGKALNHEATQRLMQTRTASGR